MPKAAMHKRSDTEARENEIWPSGQVSAMKTKSKTGSVDQRPHK
jgi:hypothetical protein